jgi:hypothetical protein
MPFEFPTLQPIGGQARTGRAPAIWGYTTTDLITAVRVAGYFNPARDMLQIGDLIYVVVTNAGALSTASWVVVKDKTATAIDVTDQTAITVTDTD